VIGRGGMGAVWLARHLELGVDVAVKLMSPRLVSDSAARARFRREARAAARLKSAHVVAVHDFGEDGETPYLVMELLEGETVAALVERRGRLPLDEIRDLVLQACAALALAHERGIVHRDIKPSNLFLCESEGRPTLKVLDFGIARTGGEYETTETTGSGLIAGSPAFMSPEQLNGGELEAATDLWSLAAVAYTLLTSELPFRCATVTETTARIREGIFTKPSTLASGVPRAVDDFFRVAFQVRPGHRFRSAREFAAAFESAARPSASAPAASALPRDDTTRDFPPVRRRRSARGLVLGCVGLSLLLSFAAYAARKGPFAAAPSHASAAGSTQPPKALSEHEPARPGLAVNDQLAAPPAGLPSGSPAPPASARRPIRGNAARPAQAPRVPSVRLPSDALMPQVTTDPLFGLPTTVTPAQPSGADSLPAAQRQ